MKLTLLFPSRETLRRLAQRDLSCPLSKGLVMSKKLKRLTALPTLLRAEGFVAVPEYRSIREIALNGGFPAQQQNNIWHWNEADLPAIAKALGLERTDTTTQRAA
jgi:hypothetical protein